MESFYEGLRTKVKVVEVISNEKDVRIRVVTHSGIEGKIDTKNINDFLDDVQYMNPEEIYNIVKVGMYLNVRVKSIRSIDNNKISIFFSCKISNVEKKRN